MGRRVEQQIAERLFQQSLIDLHDRKIPVEFRPRRDCRADAIGGEIDGGLNKFSDIAPIQLGMDHARFDAGHVQQIVYHAMETSQRLLDLAQASSGFVSLVADLSSPERRCPYAPPTEGFSARARRFGAAPVAAAPMPREFPLV